MDAEADLRQRLSSLQKLALVVGVVGLAATGVGWKIAHADFLVAWLIGFLFCLGVPLGSLGFTMVHQLTGGAWGFAVRRLFQASTRTLPVMPLFFLPIALGVHELYTWTEPETKIANLEARELVEHKAWYLNVDGFYLRAAICFAVWIGLSWVLNRLADRLDRDRSRSTDFTMRVISAPGIIAYVVTMTIAGVDWVMSLEPTWFSTMYGVLFVVSQGLTTLAFTIIVSAWIARQHAARDWLRTENYHDLGKLMFAFTLLWAYTNFSQFLIIWSGNLPDESPWYVHRNFGSWRTLTITLSMANFFLPFLLLLSTSLKRNPQRLRLVAYWMLCACWLNLLWLIVPGFFNQERGYSDGFHFHWLYITAPIGIGGVWLSLFLQILKRRPLVSPEEADLEGRFDVAAGHAGH